MDLLEKIAQLKLAIKNAIMEVAKMENVFVCLGSLEKTAKKELVPKIVQDMESVTKMENASAKKDSFKQIVP